jgi:hypothetical protein
MAMLRLVAVILVAVAAALGLAHVLELPGKMRLTRDAYFAVQPIYYPGFTWGGAVGEGGGLVATLLLFFLTPSGSSAYAPTLVALLALLAVHAVYWGVTHPINRVWLQGQSLRGLGKGFFGFATRQRAAEDWEVLRDRWELSHVVRAMFSTTSLVALVLAATS